MISLSTEKVIFDGAATLLQIRHANQSDALVVLDWRNDRLAVEMSFQQHTITRDTHERWFSDNLTDDKSTTLIGICDEQRIGVCRFLVNEDGGYADVSINLNPIFRESFFVFLKKKLGERRVETKTDKHFNNFNIKKT